MRNIFKLVVFHIHLQQIGSCYRWMQVVLVTQRIYNKALRHKVCLQLSDGTTERVSK